jgi:HEAT repeat protein
VELRWQPSSQAEKLELHFALFQGDEIAGMGSYAVPTLIDALLDSSPNVRATSADVLGKIGDPRSIVPLLICCADSEWNTRRTAAKAIDRLASDHPELLEAAARGHAVQDHPGTGPSDQPVSVRAVVDDGSRTVVQREAIRCMGRVRNVLFTETLVAALSAPQGIIRWEAALALGKMRSPAGIDALSRTLVDADTDVRCAAIWALGETGSSGALTALSSLLERVAGDSVFARAAAEALQKLQRVPQTH